MPNNSFNDNPAGFVNLNELFPVLNDKVGLSSEQFKKLVENTNFLYNHLGLADVEVGTIETIYAPPGTPFDVAVTHREVEDPTTGKTIDYFDYVFTVATTKITTGMSVERVRSDELSDMLITSTPLTGEDENKGYHFQFHAKLPKSGVTKEEISEGQDGDVLYVNPNGMPLTRQILSPNPVVATQEELDAVLEAGGTSFADILENWGRFSHFQGNFNNAIPGDMNGWSIDGETGSITNSVNSESHIGFYSPEKVITLAQKVRFVVTDTTYKTHLDTLTLVAAYCGADEQVNTSSLEEGNNHAHTLSFMRSPGPKSGFAKYGWALMVDLDFGFDSLQTASSKAFLLCDGTSLVEKKYETGLANWGDGVYIRVVRQGNVFTGYTSEFNESDLLFETAIELDLDNMTVTTKDGTIDLTDTLTEQQLLVLENFKQPNHWGYGSASQPHCLYEQQGGVLSGESVYDILNDKTYEFNPNSASWVETNVSPIISMGAGRFANSPNKDILYYNNGKEIFEVSRKSGDETSSNKVSEITETNKQSTNLYPCVKAVVDYITQNTIKEIKVNDKKVDPVDGVISLTIPTQIMETHTITASSWQAESNVSPYSHKATITATATIGDNAIVELINNNAVLFATYGFAIASISGQVLTLYSIGQPSADVALTIGIGG